MREAAANGMQDQYICYLCFKELSGSCKSPAGHRRAIWSAQRNTVHGSKQCPHTSSATDTMAIVKSHPVCVALVTLHKAHQVARFGGPTAAMQTV